MWMTVHYNHLIAYFVSCLPFAEGSRHSWVVHTLFNGSLRPRPLSASSLHYSSYPKHTAKNWAKLKSISKERVNAVDPNPNQIKRKPVPLIVSPNKHWKRLKKLRKWLKDQRMSKLFERKKNETKRQKKKNTGENAWRRAQIEQTRKHKKKWEKEKNKKKKRKRLH